MKKLFLSSVVILTASLFTVADAKDKTFKSVKDVIDGDGHCSLVEGSLDVLRENAAATLVFDFSNARMADFDRKKHTYEDHGSMADYLAAKSEDTPDNWNEVEKSVLEFTKEKINKTGFYKLHIDEDNAKYEVKIVFEYINFGNASTAFVGMFGAGGAAFSGDLIITEKETGAVALNLHIYHIYGVSGMGYHATVNKRLQCTIGDICFGKYLPALYKKNK